MKREQPVPGTEAVTSEQTKVLHELHVRRFPHADQDALLHLWCEIAEIVGKSPNELREDDVLSELCGPVDGPVDTARMSLVLDLATREREDMLPPQPAPTVGALLEYLLDK